LKELAKQHATQSPPTALEVVGPLGDYPPTTLAQLTEKAQAVVLGTLAPLRTYSGPHDDRILTDYEVHVTQLLRGALPVSTATAPGKTSPVVLTLSGGELQLEGVLVRASDPKIGRIVAGRTYLIFLRPSRDGLIGHFEIAGGGVFELAEGRLKPLLRRGDTVFSDIANSGAEEVVARLRTVAGEKR
jgi:hypothetical protein